LDETSDRRDGDLNVGQYMANKWFKDLRCEATGIRLELEPDLES